MTTIETEICQVVQKALCEHLSVDQLSASITAESSMDNIKEWDSLSFVTVFFTVAEHFELDVEEDDAIYFRSIDGIHELIREIRGA